MRVLEQMRFLYQQVNQARGPAEREENRRNTTAEGQLGLSEGARMTSVE